ncbi:MAG: DUF3027 domain-containing protein [Cryobacterium sp.]|nr:DUF3027 domain-containing protein [Cryobacterium sp.]
MSERLIPSNSDLEIARDALLEITNAADIGGPIDATSDVEGVVTIYFECLLAGYPGWRWTVNVVHLDGESSVLEATLTPGEGALLSPDWVPWSDRLAEYEAAQALLIEDDDDTDDLDDSDDDDSDDDDSADEDSDDSDADDAFDGIDIDDLNDSEDSSPGQNVTESVLPFVSENKSDESESETDDTSPKPPLKVRFKKWRKEKKKADKGK